MKKAGIWLSAFRLRTLPLALSSIFMGAAIVPANTENFGFILLLAVLTTLFLQILSNLANDYGDAQNGADNAERIGPERAVQSGAIAPKSMLFAMGLFSAFAFFSGIGLLFVAFGTEHWKLTLFFLVLGVLSIFAALKYTAGKNPYGYRGLGDLSVFLFFGLIGVAGSSFLFTKSFESYHLLPALSIGFLASAVLNLNNMRDIKGDRDSGKRTIVVMMGSSNSKIYHSFLIIGAWIALISYFMLSEAPSWAYLSLIFLPIHLLHLRKVAGVQSPSEFDPELKKIALSTFGISCVLLLVSLFY